MRKKERKEQDAISAGLSHSEGKVRVASVTSATMRENEKGPPTTACNSFDSSILDPIHHFLSVV